MKNKSQEFKQFKETKKLDRNPSYSNLYTRKIQTSKSKERSLPDNTAEDKNLSNRNLYNSKDKISKGGNSTINNSSNISHPKVIYYPETNKSVLNIKTINYGQIDNSNNKIENFNSKTGNKITNISHMGDAGSSSYIRSNSNQRKSNFNSQNNSLNLSIDKCLSPKSNYNFHNKLLERSKSTEKLQKVKTNNKSLNNKNNKYDEDMESIRESRGYDSTVHNYLTRRHTETQEKLMKLKNERAKKELNEVRDRPKISKNSRKIIERLREGNQNVVERLTDKNYNRRKEEELNKLYELNNPVVSSPKVKYYCNTSFHY